MYSSVKTLLATLCLLCTLSFATRGEGDKLHFVFELTRHGARAPSNEAEGYSISAGMLTPQGMRQRYLLGAYNRKRYVEDYQLIDVEQGPEQVVMMSTLVNRTMVSGYSELMGMFPPQSKQSEELTSAQVKAVQSDGAGAPPFKVRDQSQLNKALGSNPLPEGFTQLPIFNHLEVSMADDLDLTGCDYINKVDGYRFPAESTYYSVEWLKDDLREPITDAFDLNETQSQDMTFMDLYGYCDDV